MKLLIKYGLALTLLCLSGIAWAHKASDAYLHITSNHSGLTVRVDMALRDLEQVLDIDTDGNSQITWGEVRAKWHGIEEYIRSTTQIEGCPLVAPTHLLERRADGTYAAFTFVSNCVLMAEPVIHYRAFADVDTTHRGIAQISIAGRPDVVCLLDPQAPHVGNASSTSNTTAIGFLREGLRHIITGYDHVLFLLCLLFPAVMRRTAQGWQPRQHLREAVWPVLGIITAFTIAHSITLTLAALKWVSLPSSFIEPAIAVTIMLAALNNLWPIFRERVLLVTFAFGLLHGFGFASVLSELNLPTAQFAWALLQFNMGLELGQISIVLAAMSLMFIARRNQHYVPWVIQGGSVMAMAVALLWLVERTADISILKL